MKKLKWFLITFIMILNINVYAEGEATLKNIKVNGKAVSCSEYVCEAEVNVNNATITYEKDDPNAKVDRESGMLTSFEGENVSISIKVTNGENTNIYTFNIKKHIKSSDYSLKKLKLNDDLIDLKDDIFVYNQLIDYDVKEIKIEAVCNDSAAKVTSNTVIPFDLEESSKSIDINVQAENGDTKTYRVVLTREETPITTLKSLKLSPGNIEFDPETYEYAMEVEYSVTDILVETLPTDDNALVKITKEELVVGENTISIEVSLNRAKTNYSIIVYREENLDKSLANLKTLKIDEYSKLDFEPNVLEYVLKFKEIPDKLNIDAEAVNSDTVIDIKGNGNLKNGSVITVEVTVNEKHIKREYLLKLEEVIEEETNKTAIIIAIIVIILTMIFLFIIEQKEKKLKKKLKLIMLKNKFIKKKKEQEAKEKKETKETKKSPKKEEDEEIEII